jgi:hypothetical protein
LSLFSCAGNGDGGDKGGSGSEQQRTPNAPTPDPCPLGSRVNPVRSLVSSAVDAPDAYPLSDATSVGRIHFDSGLSMKERGAFVSALDYLDAARVQNPDPALLATMKIPSFDRSTVRQWLEDRIQYIVPENVDSSRLATLETNYTSYENPDALPPAIAPCRAQANEGHVVMSNIGALIYLVGKAKHVLFGVTADGLGTIRMTSPRSGVLQVGEGLFMVPAQYPNVLRIFQLTTLIHESRHSDGNRETTGFLHEKCVTGDYAGQAACDHNTNGPYEIEALATKAFMNSCATCSEKETQILKVLYADVASREIDDASTTAWDDAPEGRR